MEPTPHNLRACLTELMRMEGRIWARNPEEAASESRAEMLTYLMTESEWRRWRSIEAVVAEMRKLI
jgi:hypothetical protein